MGRTLGAVAIGFLAACGGEGDLPRCASGSACPAGTVCEQPVSGEKGVCVVPFAVAITAPAPDAWVGGAGAEVVATVAARSSLARPAALALRADGADAATLAAAPDGTYRGTFVPAASVDRAAALTAVAAFAGGEAVSAEVVVRVDTVPPELASATAACDPPGCFRNSPLHVAATGAADAHLADVVASVGLDGFAKELALSGAGADRAGDLDLGAWPFPLLQGSVAVRVTARDRAGNARTLERAVEATRVRWTYVAGPPITSPAVVPGGVLVAGVSNVTDQLRGIDAVTGQEKWTRTLAPTGSTTGGTISVAPSVGTNVIYVGTDDGVAYAVKSDGTAVLNVPCSTAEAIKGPPSVRSAPDEVAFATSTSGYVAAFDTGTRCDRGLVDAFSGSMLIDASGSIYAASAAAELYKLNYTGLTFTNPSWTAQVGAIVNAALALDTAGRVWTASSDGPATQLNRTTSAGDTTLIASPGGSVLGSPVVLANGDIVVGDTTKVLHRYTEAGAKRWSEEPVLDGVPGSPIVLAGGDAALVVPTQNGMVYAVGADGQIRWKGSLTSGTELREANVYTPPGSAFSLAYFGSSIGRLYAVIVDGHLDASAPWPKAFHDPANTSNAATPLP